MSIPFKRIGSSEGSGGSSKIDCDDAILPFTKIRVELGIGHSTDDFFGTRASHKHLYSAPSGLMVGGRLCHDGAAPWSDADNLMGKAGAGCSGTPDFSSVLINSNDGPCRRYAKGSKTCRKSKKRKKRDTGIWRMRKIHVYLPMRDCTA
jgi:hypothetical protein